MSKIIQAIVDTYTHSTELYITTNNLDRHASNDGWKVIDTLKFHAERKLKREIQDLEFWISRQSERETTAKTWMNRYRNHFHGDEISTNNLQASVAKSKVESFALMLMQSELSEAQSAYKEMTGATYTSIESKPDAEMPDDIKAMFAELDALEAANEPEVKAKKKA